MVEIAYQITGISDEMIDKIIFNWKEAGKKWNCR
jgi:hypothetical protein